MCLLLGDLLAQGHEDSAGGDGRHDGGAGNGAEVNAGLRGGGTRVGVSCRTRSADGDGEDGQFVNMDCDGAISGNRARQSLGRTVRMLHVNRVSVTGVLGTNVERYRCRQERCWPSRR